MHTFRRYLSAPLAAALLCGCAADKLRVERKNVGDTMVSAEVAFVIYMRGA